MTWQLASTCGAHFPEGMPKLAQGALSPSLFHRPDCLRYLLRSTDGSAALQASPGGGKLSLGLAGDWAYPRDLPLLFAPSPSRASAAIQEGRSDEEGGAAGRWTEASRLQAYYTFAQTGDSAAAWHSILSSTHSPLCRMDKLVPVTVITGYREYSWRESACGCSCPARSSAEQATCRRPRVAADVPPHATPVPNAVGSGKTTLVNRILKEHHGLRVAVIEVRPCTGAGLGAGSDGGCAGRPGCS